MQKLLDHLRAHWPQTVAVILALTVFVWLAGCPPRAPSPLDPSQKLTAEQLAAELDFIIAKFGISQADIAQQEQIRKVIINNALLIAETGTLNPLGILTGLAALYGAGSATNSVKNVLKKKKPSNPPPPA